MDYQDSQGAAYHAEELKRQQAEIDLISAIKVWGRLRVKAASEKVRSRSKQKISQLSAKYYQLTGKYYRRES